MEPHSLVGETGEGGWSGRGLACGLQDQRHGPPTGSGGRVWFVDGRKKVGKNGFSSLFPKGTCPRPQPAQPVDGPLRAFQCEAAGQVSRKRYSLPHIIPPEKGFREEPPPPGVLSPISSQEMGPRPGRPRFPAVPTAGRPQQGPGFQPPAGLSSRETKKSPPHTRQGLM